MAAGEARPITADDQSGPVPRTLAPVTGTTPRSESEHRELVAAGGHPGATRRPRTAPRPDVVRDHDGDNRDVADTARALGCASSRSDRWARGRQQSRAGSPRTCSGTCCSVPPSALGASIGRRSRARPILQVGSVRVCEPAPGVAEAAVVVAHAQPRACRRAPARAAAGALASDRGRGALIPHRGHDGREARCRPAPRLPSVVVGRQPFMAA